MVGEVKEPGPTSGHRRRQTARELAIYAFMLLEGAFILCRAWKSTEPMEIAGRAAVRAGEKP